MYGRRARRDVSCWGTTLYKCGSGPQCQELFDMHPPEEQGRLIQGAASRSGLWHLRTCAPPHRRRITQSTTQELGTTAVGGNTCQSEVTRCSKPCCGSLFIGAINHWPSQDSWKETGEEILLNHMGPQLPQRYYSLGLEGLKRSTAHSKYCWTHCVGCVSKHIILKTEV